MAHSIHDTNIRAIAQASARTAYVAMCLSLCWGIFVATGWIGRLTGRDAMRRSHIILATFAIVTAVVHAGLFLLLSDTNEEFALGTIVIPFAAHGQARWALGIVGLEVMIAIGVSSALQRFFVYRRWLNAHRFAYPAVALAVGHSWLGAAANGNMQLLWLAGLTVLVPTALLSGLRFVPARFLVSLGLLAE
jgi:sulfoxide reductase heme-binding subunit YedZ